MAAYRALREKYGFIEMVRTPELASAITLQPIHEFGMDAAIIFSDILVTASAIGSDLVFEEKVGPVIHNPVRTLADVKALDDSGIEAKLRYVGDAIRMAKSQLDIPLIGFAGAPFTVAAYMIEGRSSSDIKTFKRMMSCSPQIVHALLDKLTTVTIDYLRLQITAGVDALQLFDTWAGLLAADDFVEFSAAYMHKIVSAIRLSHPTVPITLFCKNSGQFLDTLTAIQPNAISLDWQSDLPKLRRVIPAFIAVQGNLDPALLYAPRDVLQKRTLTLLEAMRGQSGFVVNLGHGVYPDIDPENVRLLVETVKGFR